MARPLFETVGLLAALVFVLLLFAPGAPPQVALYGAVVVLALGVVVPAAYAHAREVLSSPSEQSAAGDHGKTPAPIEDAKRAYVEGEISEAEFEKQLDAALDSEQTKEREQPETER